MIKVCQYFFFKSRDNPSSFLLTHYILLSFQKPILHNCERLQFWVLFSQSRWLVFKSTLTHKKQPLMQGSQSFPGGCSKQLWWMGFQKLNTWVMAAKAVLFGIYYIFQQKYIMISIVFIWASGLFLAHCIFIHNLLYLCMWKNNFNKVLNTVCASLIVYKHTDSLKTFILYYIV